ncbi:uncharacterized protein LOC109829445 [Asparagus officinalis]|uniref:uncharacterized protein LOC109829445 n=1 Tax=Asparagus officinalis TaxID=4686 RepID=UPI00098E64BA|nr:uncharacterized protein LOC109829445 [Asparagus officinalis]
MDALREFSTKPLEWALEHVVEPGYTLTLLGVMPWLSLPLLCKTWLDIWTLDPGDLSNIQDKSEWKNDPKHQRLRTMVDLCDARGVVLLMKVVMGYPVKLMVLEQTTNLHASWIVFDRYQRKRRSFYKRRIPCNMVMMKEDGMVDVLRVNPVIDSRETPTSLMSSALQTPGPKLISCTQWIDFLHNDSRRREG